MSSPPGTYRVTAVGGGGRLPGEGSRVFPRAGPITLSRGPSCPLGNGSCVDSSSISRAFSPPVFPTLVLLRRGG